MNIVKGIDRIAFALAILAAIPGFILGLEVTIDRLKKKTPEYKTWEEKYDTRIGYLKDKAAKKLGQESVLLTPEEFNTFLELKEDDPVLRDILSSKPAEYWYPPLYKRIIGGLITASLSLLIVLFTICGMTRGVKWIVGGFIDEKTNE